MDTSWRRSLAQALSAVEDRAAGWRDIVARCHAKSAGGLVVGVTGPPGAGKSTLIDLLASQWSIAGHRVGILAIDPASPFSGGAVLGDRVRMRRSENDPRVFIRSMSARGHSGGLNAAAIDLCSVLVGHGITRVLLETVGVGQNEVEVAFVADCTLVVSVPGLGDLVQAAKAGLLEVGDIYVVNKGDLAGAANVARDLESMLALIFPGLPGVNGGAADRSMVAGVPGAIQSTLAERFGLAGDDERAWHPPVVTVSATQSDGLTPLSQFIEAFDRWLSESGHGARRRQARVERQLQTLLTCRLFDDVMSNNARLAHMGLGGWASRVSTGGIDPHSAVDEILGEENRRET